MSHMPKVIVCGGGIGGLSTAHELAKRGFAVTIYERHDIVGGLARSKRYQDTATGFHYPVEYSWRVYGTGYRNLLRILNEIPLHHRPQQSVFHNLLKIGTYIFPRFDEKEVTIAKGRRSGELTNHFKKGDLFKMIDLILRCMTMSKARMDSLDHVTWADYCHKLSPEAKKYMVTMWGPVLGMDPTYMSVPVIARMIQVLMGGLLGSASSLYLMNQPTNDGWFTEWAEYLQTKDGVNIVTNAEIQGFELDENQITGVHVRTKNNHVPFIDRADYVVCSMSVEAVAKIVSQDTQLASYPSLQKMAALANVGRQVQLSVQLFLDKKFVYPVTQHNVLYLPDTPWAIIIEPQDEIWGKTDSDNPDVRSVWSVGICQTDVPGIKHHKAFTTCTEQEIAEEVWAQIVKSYHASSIRTETGGTIDTAHLLKFYMWDSFKFDASKKEMTIWEPKFSNNATGLQYQPSVHTELANFFFATGYTKTDRFIYSMEAAAEAGTLAANAIIDEYNKLYTVEKRVPTRVYSFSTTLFPLKPLLVLDRLFLAAGLPHPSKLTFNNSLVLIGLYLLLIVGVVASLISHLV